MLMYKTLTLKAVNKVKVAVLMEFSVLMKMQNYNKQPNKEEQI